MSYEREDDGRCQSTREKRSNASLLDDLLSEPPPAGCADVAAGEGAGRERHDLVDLAAGDFYFDGGVQEIRRIHD